MVLSVRQHELWAIQPEYVMMYIFLTCELSLSRDLVLWWHNEVKSNLFQPHFFFQFVTLQRSGVGVMFYFLVNTLENVNNRSKMMYGNFLLLMLKLEMRLVFCVCRGTCNYSMCCSHFLAFKILCPSIIKLLAGILILPIAEPLGLKESLFILVVKTRNQALRAWFYGSRPRDVCSQNCNKIKCLKTFCHQKVK